MLPRQNTDFKKGLSDEKSEKKGQESEEKG